MPKYRITYFSKEGRKRDFFKTFKKKATKDQYISKKIEEGAYNIKTEEVRVRGSYDSELESIILSKKKKVVSCGCIYALIHKNKVVYIGQTYSIMGRLNQHINSSKEFDHYTVVEWVDAGQSYLDRKEAEYIRALNPKYNQVGRIS
jgi:hypothetical protein